MERVRRKKNAKRKRTKMLGAEPQYIGTPEAVDRVEEATGWRPTANTIRNWCKEGMGKQVGHKWLVDVKKLQEVIDGSEKKPLQN